MTTKVTVDAENLRRVLQALIGPPHHIRELQCLRSPIFPLADNPIDSLVEEFNAQVRAANQEVNDELST